jgi:hypothetical protein
MRAMGDIAVESILPKTVMQVLKTPETADTNPTPHLD